MRVTWNPTSSVSFFASLSLPRRLHILSKTPCTGRILSSAFRFSVQTADNIHPDVSGGTERAPHIGMPVCPRCRNDLSRVHRTLLERVLYARLFECRMCGYRSF